MRNQSQQNTFDINYDSSVDVIYAEAWKKTSGIKTTFWKAIVSIALIMVITSQLIPPLSGIITAHNDLTAMLLSEALGVAANVFILMPLITGLLMITVKHCTGIPAPIGTLFQYFRYWKRLWIFPVALWALGWIETLFTGFFMVQFFIAFAATLVGITFFMYIPLVIEKNASLKAALLMSFQAVSQHISQVCGFILAIIIILFATTFTLGIGLIWTLPWILNAIAIFYRELFGIQISLV